jgi:hypothetical protein
MLDAGGHVDAHAARRDGRPTGKLTPNLLDDLGLTGVRHLKLPITPALPPLGSREILGPANIRQRPGHAGGTLISGKARTIAPSARYALGAGDCGP